ncbi:nucleotide sugar dehydrogenase [Halovenus sp. WSH3]|uniref:UDP-N-acetyl-D-mannosamine dehydrogenase n=1 Tax=Halovenus carboxidivorans TaxID=2692199 RepID=A0A6B0T797_9EURY|nr:nucleotide sugar dehydrogenase [Halovenus carboxidivorans]MXR51172.1 nucleotide sugar dehydrogenase [Halovenus carboxidivorans]
MDVGIIGGGGHVGLPTGLVLAESGFSVTLIDTDAERLETIEDGVMPFTEEGGEEMLTSVLDAGRLSTTTDVEAIAECDVVMIVIGTPIDEHHNPEMENLLGVVDAMEPHLSEDQLVLLRSTIYPGTTKLVRNRLEEIGFTVGEDIFLAFVPERVTQHRALDEIVSLPQLVGAFDEASGDRAEALFESVIEADCHRLTPAEAELGKLFTNMWRYLTFAAANEFYLIADSFSTHHEVNIHRIIEKTSENYPRFDVPSPGANVGGPCLTKDGWFLVDNIPYNELVSAAFQINEGMPAQLIDKLSTIAPDPDRVGVLGMTFKANSDDTRNSVAFKFRKQLRMNGYDDVVEIEPNCEGFDDWEDLEGVDWLVLMTPHDEFKDLNQIAQYVDNPDCVVSDSWGLWDVSYETDQNGWFRLEELRPRDKQTEAT